MTKVFVGGSRRISRLNDAVRHRLDTIISKGIDVLVGDANGADKAVQAYLHQRGYERVHVFCTGEICRNNVGAWSLERVQPKKAESRKDRSFYALKDAAMSQEATHGLMLWDGKSLGTLVNVVRLVRRGKAAVVYVGPVKAFAEIRKAEDYTKLFKYCDRSLIKKAEIEVDKEEGVSHQTHSKEKGLPLFEDSYRRMPGAQ